MYVRKERTAPVDYGAAGDNKSTGYSSMFWPGYPIGSPEEYWQAEYNRYKALRTLPQPIAVNNGYDVLEGENGAQDKFNSCHHVKTKTVNYPLLEVCWLGRYYGYDPYYRYVYNVPLVEFNSVRHLGEVPLSVRSRAWHSMQPRFESKCNLLVSLFELKDFRDVAKAAYNCRFELYKLGEKFRKYRNKGVTETKDPTGGIAGLILTKNLAIDPTVKDVTDIMATMNKIVRDEQQKFAESGSDYQTSHYSEELYRTELVNWSPTYPWYGTGYSRVTKFSATLQYKYDYTMRSTVDAWIKYWGLTGTFEAFWNMIPFSFVADYFICIGKSLHMMEHDPNVNLMDYVYGESCKTTYDSGAFVRKRNTGEVFIIDGKYITDSLPHIVSGSRGSIYTRGRCEPYYGPATPRLKLPSEKQALNIVALLRTLL